MRIILSRIWLSTFQQMITRCCIKCSTISKKNITDSIRSLEELKLIFRHSRLYPIIVFDVRHQSEKLAVGIIDIQLKFEFRDVVPANTEVYVTTISDRVYQFESDGKNLVMVLK